MSIDCSTPGRAGGGCTRQRFLAILNDENLREQIEERPGKKFVT